MIKIFSFCTFLSPYSDFTLVRHLVLVDEGTNAKAILLVICWPKD